MSFIPLTPLDHVGAIPAYKAGIDAMQLGLESEIRMPTAKNENGPGREKHITGMEDAKTNNQLPPLAIPSGVESSGESGQTVGRGPEGNGDQPSSLEEAGGVLQVVAYGRKLALWSFSSF